MRTRTLLLLAIAMTVLPIGLTAMEHGGRATRDARPRAVDARAATPEMHALAVLRGWDRRRARAWAAGDPVALARLYVPGSSTRARDVGDLHRWIRRGLRVIGLHQQVAGFRLADRQPGRMVVVVTDRTVDAVAVGGRRRVGLPASRWATHWIVLARAGATWRVAEVRAQPAR